MKKLFSLIIFSVLVISLLSGCGAGGSSSATGGEKSSGAPGEVTTEESSERPVIRIGALKGPTSMGLAKLLSENDAGKTGNQYEYTLAGSADELTPKLIKGDMDIIIAPVNLGAVLYQKTGGTVQMAGITTLGVNYIVESGGETIRSAEDLRGRTLFATGKGSIPEYVLRLLLVQSGLDPDKDLTIEWKSEPTEVVAAMAAMDDAVAMLPQPYVTAAKSTLENLHVAIDLTSLWSELNEDSLLVIAGIIVRKDFASKNADALNAFISELSSSVAYVNANTADAAQLIEGYGIAKAAVAEKAIPDCNIVCITGAEFKDGVSGFLSQIYELAPDFIGGKLPGEDFYLIYE